MDCGKPIFFKNGRMYIQHDNGVDCVELVIPTKSGPSGARGPAGPVGAGFNFGLNITSDGVEGSGAATQTLTAIPSVGAVVDYTYAFAMVSRDTSIGSADPTLGAVVGNTVVVQNLGVNPVLGMVRATATHTATGTIQQSEFFVRLDGVIP